LGRRKEERLTPGQRIRIVELLQTGELSKTALAARFGVSRSAIRKVVIQESRHAVAWDARA
jgi:transposase-like protein